jgi:hypothetical protein
MEHGEQVANGSMGWRGWQHEMQRARGFVPEHEEGLRVRTRGWGRGGFEGAPESHTSLRRACGSDGCGSGPLSLWLNDPADAPLTSLARRRGG